MMELECIKYKEKMNVDEAYCRHPDDYCKYRTSCIIHFMSSQNRAKKKSAETAGKTPQKKDSNSKK